MSAGASGGAELRSHDGNAIGAAASATAVEARGSGFVLGPRIAFDLAGRGLEFLRLQSGIAKTLVDQIVPGQRPDRVAVARHAAADNQPVGGARHRDIEQAAIFVLGVVEHFLTRERDACGIVRLAAGPDGDAMRVGGGVALRQMDQPQPLRVRWRRRGVNQEHDGRFKSLGAMHGHDADFVARDFHVALHLGIGRAQPRHETLQRGRRLALVGQREFEKLVERVGRLMAEPF